MSPILLQDWETGDLNYETLIQVDAELERDTADASCGWKEMCYCGTNSCRRSQSGFRWIPQAYVLSAPPRNLQIQEIGTVPQNRRADISVVFGIQVDGGAQLLGELAAEDVWSYSSAFEVSQPWAQRNIYELCTEPPAVLRVTEALCWMKDFRDFLERRGERFPIHNSRFDSLALDFFRVGLTGAASSKEKVWIKDGKVKASFLSFLTDFSQEANVEDVMEYKEHWDTSIGAYNAKASRFANRAWHTSNLWVRAEAQKELISSTMITLVICVILAFAAMLLFTFDAVLSLLVVIATVGVISGLAFFIVCVMQWPIGPVEVIALIVFIGYAVTYSLHITHKYGDPQALQWEPEPVELGMAEREWLRYQRTGFALSSIGAAAVGSAMTTCGCAVFLLGCTLTIFTKLGGVVLTVTLMSIITALGPLPAALLLFGPLEPGKACRPSARSWKSMFRKRDPAASFTEVGRSGPPSEYACGTSSPIGPMPGDGVIFASALSQEKRRSWKQSTSLTSHRTVGSASSIGFPAANSVHGAIQKKVVKSLGADGVTSVDAVRIEVDRDRPSVGGGNVTNPLSTDLRLSGARSTKSLVLPRQQE